MMMGRSLLRRVTKMGFAVEFFNEYVDKGWASLWHFSMNLFIKVEFLSAFFNEYVYEGGGLGAMFGNQGRGHQGGNNKALQYR